MVTATVARKQVRQAMPTTASMGNSPVPTINKAENDHMTKFRLGIIQRSTGIEVRSAVIGHIQRGGAPTLFDRILGTRLGVKAAELAIEGRFGHMAALRGDRIVSVSLSEATSELKTVSPEWLKLLDAMTAELRPQEAAAS